MKFLTLAVLFASVLVHADVDQDFEGLGGNRILLEKAKELNPEKEVQIVQERVVPRRHRFEISPEVVGTFGGDTYSRTSAIGMNVQYHFNPHWSVGVRYQYDFNKLTPEGNAAYNRAKEDFQKHPDDPRSPIPTLDYPKNETFATLYWYPIYGKMNLLDKGIAHFDVYGLAGYGRVTLSSGSVPSYTGGLGMGFWWTQHFSSRVEMRYQNYTAKYFNTPTKLDLAVASIQMGWLL